MRIVYPRSGTHDINAPKFPSRNLEHVLQLSPIGHVCLQEYSSSLPLDFLLVFIDQFLRLRTQREIRDQDVAVTGKEEGGEGIVDACSHVRTCLHRLYNVKCKSEYRTKEEAGKYIPDPAPVTIAVLPLTEKGCVFGGASWE
jgi:hypothetical protein